LIGIDECEMGEFAYDYVGLEPELKPTFAPQTYQIRNSQMKGEI